MEEPRCDICTSKKNGNCKGFPDQTCKDAEKNDLEILRNATDRLDGSRHKMNKYGSRSVEKREQKIKEAVGLPKPPKEKPKSEAKPSPERVKRWIEAGRVLFYKNKYTGEIESGVVTTVTMKYIWFRFGTRTVRIDHTYIDNRLFYTAEEAKRYGRTQADAK